MHMHEAMFKRGLCSLLKHVVQVGELTVLDPGGRVDRFGPGGGPAVTVRLHKSSLYRALMLNPGLRLGEAYMDGTLTIEAGNLRDFLHICTEHDQIREHLLQRMRRVVVQPLRYCRQFNPLHRARSNVAHHYDLSDELFALFLDSDRQYSCAYFQNGNESLEHAQHQKRCHIAAKLLLEPDMRVLDIGSGWGGLALHLARTASVQVKGITLSDEQLSGSRGRVREAGLDDQVTFEMQDYRAEREQYDRVVSVGMFEHVGVNHYYSFFRRLKSLLKPDGVALIHAIGTMAPPADGNPWINKYIFPGGYCPALSEVLAAVEKAGLWVTDVEIWRLHYADTLQEWNRRFQQNRDRAKALYDERFCRMWEFYLVACEVAFRNRRQMVFQIQLSRQCGVVPRTRDYLWEYKNRSTPSPNSVGQPALATASGPLRQRRLDDSKTS